MKYCELDCYLRDNGYSPILCAGSHIKYTKPKAKMHILIKRRRPNYRAGNGLIARVKRIVEKINDG